MDIAPISIASAQGAPGMLPEQLPPTVQDAGSGKPAETARQFEAILMRQILSESMKDLTEGSSGQVYGYFVTNSLADAMTKGGGIGLTSILEAQLKQ